MGQKGKGQSRPRAPMTLVKWFKFSPSSGCREVSQYLTIGGAPRGRVSGCEGGGHAAGMKVMVRERISI